jgi:hypothetical protein
MALILTTGVALRQRITGIRPDRFINVTTPAVGGDALGELGFHGSFGGEVLY